MLKKWEIVCKALDPVQIKVEKNKTNTSLGLVQVQHNFLLGRSPNASFSSDCIAVFSQTLVKVHVLKTIRF